MRGSGWIRAIALLVVAAVSVSGSAKGDPEEIEGGVQNPWITPRDISLVVPAESQQVSVVAAADLHASATGYGKGSHKGHKGYKGGYHDKKGYKGHKGYKADKGKKSSHYGDHGKSHKSDYHDKGGKHYKGHDDKHKYYGDEHKGKKGKKGHHYGSKGHHNKGHKDKGFKNVYHKEEYHHSKKFYDDHDSKKYHDKYDDFDSYFKSDKGKDFKGGHYKRGTLQRTYPSDNLRQMRITEPLMISRAKAALEKINDISPKSTSEKRTSNTITYANRVILDAGETSRQRARFAQEEIYDEQCQVFDLRMIRRYLKYCRRHKGKTHDDEREPSCNEEDIIKIRKYLTFCQEPFFAKASRHDKKEYEKLMAISEKLDAVSEVPYSEAQYAEEDVCNVADLRQLKTYLKDCSSRKKDAQGSGRHECGLHNFENSLNYLSSCESTFLLKASRRDKQQYRRLVSVAIDLIKLGTKQNEKMLKEEPEGEPITCSFEDLREAQSYVTECERIKKMEGYQKQYGSHICKRKHMLKLHKYLSECKAFFISNVSRQDKKKYGELMSRTAKLSTKQKKHRKERGSDQHRVCKIEYLRKIPDYLKSCDQSQSCKSNHLGKVNRFLVICEDFFTGSASHSDKTKYSELLTVSEYLDAKSKLQDEGRDRMTKERIENICKINVLKKIPKYLKGCMESESCSVKQISNVIEFLSFCEDFFTLACSPKDRGKYKRLQYLSKKLVTRENKAGVKGTKETKYNKEPNCNLNDLKKIPKYLSDCVRTQNCKQRQLMKVHHFLFVCKIPFTSTASPKDKKKYKNLEIITEKLSNTKQGQDKERVKEKGDSRQPKCEIHELRRIPKYLKSCIRNKNCESKQLTEVDNYLKICRIAFYKKATAMDKDKYRELSQIVKTLIKPVKKKTVKKGRQTEERTGKQSKCQVEELRKIPEYLTSCVKSQKCKRAQLLKVHQYLVTCEGQFTEKSSKRDEQKYKKILRLSKTLATGSQLQKKRRREMQHTQQKCQAEDLMKISKDLSACNEKAKHKGMCKRQQVINMRKYLLTCKAVFTNKASRREKTKYRSSMSISSKLLGKNDTRGRTKPTRGQRVKPTRGQREKPARGQTTKSTKGQRAKPTRGRKDKTARGQKTKSTRSRSTKPTKGQVSKVPTCSIGNLRKVQKFLKDCAIDVSLKSRTGSKRGLKRGTCGKRDLSKANEFLTSCKKKFFKRASKSSKKQYEKLIVLSAKDVSRKATVQAKGKRKTSTVRQENKCNVQDLRKIQKYLKDCSDGNKKETTENLRGKRYSRRRQTFRRNVCKRRISAKILSYLTSCRETFLKNASSKDKKQYKHLIELSSKSSKQTQKKIDKQVTKKPQTFTCEKQALLRIEKHYKYCKDKLKKGATRKSDVKVRRRRGDKTGKKHIKEVRRRVSGKCQRRRYESYPNKTPRQHKHKENERLRSCGKRSGHKNRQGGKHHDKHGKKGHHEKGKYHDDHKGHKGHYDHKGHYGHKSSYGKKGGHEGDYGHHDHKGHGHDDHHGGYGHDDHHGHGYGHDDHHGSHGHGHHGHGYSYSHRVPVYCNSQGFCMPFSPPQMYTFPFHFF